MNLDFTSTFHKNAFALREGYRLIVNQGGTWSSKTWSVVQLLSMLAMYTSLGIVSVVSESLPHLKRGCIRDFKSIMDDSFDDNSFNKSDQIYVFPKSQIEFFGADDATKMRGGRRNYLFINEINNVTLDSFNELDVRTRGSTICDFNPVADFYIHELLRANGITDFSKDCFPAKKDVCFIHSTYLDAKEYLPQKVLEKIESRKNLDPNWWRVYGLGLVGKIEGLVYPNFAIVDEMPILHSPVEIFGLDFGYSTDPTALTRNITQDKNLYSEELIYETGMTNKQIAERFEQLGIKKHHDVIVADSAEPKSIQEICDYGYNVLPSVKGEGSVEHGIQKVNQYTQHWLRASTNCIKEQRNFMYIKDKNGKFTEKTTHYFSHGMDSRRYAIAGLGNITGYDLTAMSNWD